jgi:salicylate hydroxylase
MRILIAGGGIGGLVAALALAQRNIEVDILEQQAEPRELGAGISIYANGARVLSSLGLDDALRPLRHQSAGAQLRGGKTGRIVSELPLRDFHQKRWPAACFPASSAGRIRSPRIRGALNTTFPSWTKSGPGRSST